MLSMAKHTFSQSVRKFVRREKARLRRADTVPEEYKDAIRALYKRFSPKRSSRGKQDSEKQAIPR